MRLLRYFSLLIWPQWRTVDCPHCGAVLRERSGWHMTRAVGKHMRKYHPARHELNLRAFERWQKGD